MSLTDEIIFFLRNHPGNYRDLRMRLIGDTYLADKKLDEEIRQKELRAKEKVINATLWRLRKNGMIENLGGSWFLTKLGKTKTKKKDILKDHLVYPKIKISDDKIIISFDIPESHRRYRNWLRIELVHLGFKIMQKSVWLGPSPLPKEFIKALQDRKLIAYLKFFEAKESQIA
jgi:DNA-binding transcriptional regulator PaaX